MLALLLTLHVTAGALVLGVLFLESLTVVMALRLPGEPQREGVRTVLCRAHLYVYYPILAVVVVTGLINAAWVGAFAQGLWLHWKLVFVLLLMGLGLLTGGQLRAGAPGKGAAMAVHVLTFVVSLMIVFLAVIQPF